MVCCYCNNALLQPVTHWYVDIFKQGVQELHVWLPAYISYQRLALTFVHTYAMQLQEALRADQSRLSAQAAQLEAWQAQLAEQQARLEELEGAAAEALAEARDAAAATLQERDQVGDGLAWSGLVY